MSLQISDANITGPLRRIRVKAHPHRQLLYGNIRIWNFYTGALIIKIQIGNNWLYGVCVWNDSFLFVGCSDKTIKLIELKEGFIAKNMKGHNNSVLTIKKIEHPKFGKCLISQGNNEDSIIIWEVK